MKRADQDRLLNEIFTTAESSSFRQASFERGLAMIRRRRLMRRGVSCGAVAALLGLIAWQVTAGRHPSPPLQPTRAALPAAVAPEMNTVKVRFINDEELLGLFPDRPVALIGKPGHQRLLFLDELNGRPRDKM